MNIKQRTESQKKDGTLKCTKSKEQFTSNWNLNNHKRDNHPKTKDCQYVKIGRCKFPENECWDKHQTDSTSEKSNGNNEKMQCHTCRESFKPTQLYDGSHNERTP